MKFIVKRKLGREIRTRQFNSLYKMCEYLWGKVDFYRKYDGNFYYEIFIEDKAIFYMEKDKPYFEYKSHLIQFMERVVEGGR